MSKRLSTADTMSLGFMTFAFFLGAGNIIFPPLAGMLAGDNLLPAMLGFLVTAVGLPLVGLIAVAKVGGGIPVMTRLLPRWVGTSIALIIFIIIGPTFAAPRTGLVAYEIGLVPFLDTGSSSAQLLFTVAFFSLALIFALYPGKLMDTIGKVLTPALLVLLLVLAASVIIAPQDPIAAASGAWVNNAFSHGFVEGYMTMDALGSLIFGGLIVDVLRRKGIDDSKAQARYLSLAALIAAAGLIIVYMSLFYLGATSSILAAGVDNGGAVLSAYVVHVFGLGGSMILAGVVSLACLTTAVGLFSACGEFFNELMPKISYRRWVMIIAILCTTIANVGLSQLISISIPVLFLVYPIAMALILFSFVDGYIQQQKLILTSLIAVTACVGVLSALNVMGLAESVVALFTFLPLYEQHLAWVPVTFVVVLYGMLYKRELPSSL